MNARQPHFPSAPTGSGIATSRLWEEQARAFDDLSGELARLASENRRYREALEFVADTRLNEGYAKVRLRECIDVAAFALQERRDSNAHPR